MQLKRSFQTFISFLLGVWPPLGTPAGNIALKTGVCVAGPGYGTREIGGGKLPVDYRERSLEDEDSWGGLLWWQESLWDLPLRPGAESFPPWSWTKELPVKVHGPHVWDIWGWGHRAVGEGGDTKRWYIWWVHVWHLSKHPQQHDLRSFPCCDTSRWGTLPLCRAIILQHLWSPY